MNKYKILSIIIASAIAFNFFFLFSKNVFAATYEQPISSFSESFNVGSIDVGQTLTNAQVATTTFTISAIELAISTASNFGFGDGCVWDGAGENCFIYATSTISSGDYDGATGSAFTAVSQTIVGDISFVLFKPCSAGAGVSCTDGETDNQAITIQVGTGEKLWFALGINGGAISNVYGTVNSATYANGFTIADILATPMVQNTGTVRDLYFKVFNETDTILSNGQIQITIPQNGQTLTDEQLSDWGIQYNYSSTTNKNNFILGVRYGSSSTMQIGILNADFVDSQFLPVFGSASTTIPKTEFPPIGDYYAQAFIRYIDSTNGIYTYVATSTVISFSLTTQGDPFNPPFLNDSGSNFDFANSDCNLGIQVFNIFGSNASGTLQTLLGCTVSIFFEPSTTGTNYITNAVQGFGTFFPFNIFFDFQKTITNYITNSGNIASSSLSFTLPVPGATTFNLLSPTMLESNLGATTKNKIFEIQKNIMWGALGIGIILTIL